MTRKKVSDFLIYKWRYFFGYSFLVLAVGIMIAIAGLYVPGELRQAEIDSALKSGALSVQSMTPGMVVNLPYHALQRVSFDALGISTLSIKLPSIILGTLTTLGLFLLLKTWFRRNIAIITAPIMATSTQFLFLSQDGSPLIMHAFLSVWLLFVATYVTRQKLFGTLWKVLTGVLVAASFYVPLGIYLVLAMSITMLFHPHVRHIVKRFSRTKLTVAIILGITVLAPVIYASTIDHMVAWTLLGIPRDHNNLLAAATRTLSDLFGFFTPSTNGIVRPLYSMGLTILIVLGIYKLVTFKYTARSYIVSIWGVILFGLSLVNSNYSTALFSVAAILVAFGITMLVSDWYKLFPLNPYARIAGLIPLSIVVVGIMASGVVRYVNNYQYNGALLSGYSKDLTLVRSQIPQAGALTLVTSSDEKTFYTMVAQFSKTDQVIVLAPDQPLPVTGSFAATRQARIDRNIAAIPTNIITNSRSQDADRLYIYEPNRE